MAPGGRKVSKEECYLNIILEKAISDGRVIKPNFLNKLGYGRKGHYEVYLVVDNNYDYHWYRRDKGGMWSQKHGSDVVTNMDGFFRPIKNPAKIYHYYGNVNYNGGGIYLWVKR